MISTAACLFWIHNVPKSFFRPFICVIGSLLWAALASERRDQLMRTKIRSTKWPTRIRLCATNDWSAIWYLFFSFFHTHTHTHAHTHTSKTTLLGPCVHAQCWMSGCLRKCAFSFFLANVGRHKHARLGKGCVSFFRSHTRTHTQAHTQALTWIPQCAAFVLIYLDR